MNKEIKPTWEKTPFVTNSTSQKEVEKLLGKNAKRRPIAFFRGKGDALTLIISMGENIPVSVNNYDWSNPRERSKYQRVSAKFTGEYGICSSSGYNKCRLRECIFQVIDGALVYRFFYIEYVTFKDESGKQRVMFKPAIETFRLCFKGTTAWTEMRDKKQHVLERKTLKASLYSSFWTKVERYHLVQEKCEYGKLKEVKLPFSLSNEPTCVYPAPIAAQFYNATAKAHFSKDVPEEAIAILKDNEKVKKDGYLFVKEPYGPKTQAIYNDGNKLFCFKKNVETGEWSSTPVMSKNEKIYTSEAMTLFRGTSLEEYARTLITIMDGFRYDYGNVHVPPVVNTLNRAQKYPLIEQCMKTPGLEVLALLINDSLSHREKNMISAKDAKKGIREVFGMSAKGLKQVLKQCPTLRLSNGGRRTLQYFVSPKYKKAFSDPTARMLASIVFAPSNIPFTIASESVNMFDSIAKRFKNEGATDENVRLITEYRDYINTYRDLKKKASKKGINPVLKEQIGLLTVGMKPSRIRDAHQRATYLMDMLGGNAEKYNDDIAKIKATESDKYEYTDPEKDLMVILPKNAEDIIREGAMQQHCVGRAGYIQSMAKGRTHIAFVRRIQEPEAPLLTLEIRDGVLEQCFGYHDSFNKDEKTAGFLEEYLQKNHFGRRATILKAA